MRTPKPPICSRCNRDHPQTERCDGTAIDWAARRARALAWGRALRASRGGRLPAYQVAR